MECAQSCFWERSESVSFGVRVAQKTLAFGWSLK